MADTMQIVSWALEESCPFRSGDDWQEPGRTSEQLGDLRSVSDASREGRIVDGICVTSWSLSMDDNFDISNLGSCVGVPSSGFRMEERFGKHGGLQTVQKTCEECPANATNRTSSELAMCHGYLSINPDSKEVEEALSAVSVELGLDFASCFLATSPIWYGLWIDSPLSREQTSKLLTVFSRAFEGMENSRTGIEHFLKALEISSAKDIPLHVSLLPLGHTDFGWYTVFPHCPRCMANAPVGRWKDSYPTDRHQCEVCGNMFIPNDTHRQERMDWDGDADSLENLLGDVEYESFVRRYVISQGGSEEQAENIWQGELEYRERRRRIEAGEHYAAVRQSGPPCPMCGKPLRTDKAKQCFECGADWH